MRRAPRRRPPQLPLHPATPRCGRAEAGQADRRRGNARGPGGGRAGDLRHLRARRTGAPRAPRKPTRRRRRARARERRRRPADSSAHSEDARRTPSHRGPAAADRAAAHAARAARQAGGEETAPTEGRAERRRPSEIVLRPADTAAAPRVTPDAEATAAEAAAAAKQFEATGAEAAGAGRGRGGKARGGRTGGRRRVVAGGSPSPAAPGSRRSRPTPRRRRRSRPSPRRRRPRLNPNRRDIDGLTHGSLLLRCGIVAGHALRVRYLGTQDLLWALIARPRRRAAPAAQAPRLAPAPAPQRGRRRRRRHVILTVETKPAAALSDDRRGAFTATNSV